MKTKFSNYDSVYTQNLVGGEDNVDYLSKDVQYLERFNQDTKQRRILVNWMMVVVTLWLFFVLLFTIFGNVWCLKIDRQVLITLLATTTINVLGLANIILKGLFGHKNRQKKKDS